MNETPLDRLRQICLALPETEERISHGEPSWFIRGKKMFVTYAGQHHGNRPTFWCAAPPGAQEILIGLDAARFFVPPYVGHRGWLGVRLDGNVDWEHVRFLVRDAYRLVAPKKLAVLLADEDNGAR